MEPGLSDVRFSTSGGVVVVVAMAVVLSAIGRGATIPGKAGQSATIGSDGN